MKNEEKERDGGFVNREYYKKPQVSSGEFVCKNSDLLKIKEAMLRAEVTILKNEIDRKDADLWKEKMRREHIELELKSKQEEKSNHLPYFVAGVFCGILALAVSIAICLWLK